MSKKNNRNRLDRWQRTVIDYINQLPEKKSNRSYDREFFKTELDETIDTFNQEVSQSGERLSVVKELDILFEKSSKIEEADVLEIKE